MINIRLTRTHKLQLYITAVHVAGETACLWLVFHRKQFGIHIRCRLAKSQAFPVLDPLVGAGRPAR